MFGWFKKKGKKKKVEGELSDDTTSVRERLAASLTRWESATDWTESGKSQFYVNEDPTLSETEIRVLREMEGNQEDEVIEWTDDTTGIKIPLDEDDTEPRSIGSYIRKKANERDKAVNQTSRERKKDNTFGDL